MKPKNDNSGLSVLTLKDTTAVNFKVSLELLVSQGFYGVFFGTDATPTDDITASNNADADYQLFQTSGYGHVHQMVNENQRDGYIFVQGIDANTSQWVNAEHDDKFNRATQWYRTRNDYDLPNFSTAINNENLQELNIEVINGCVKVWWTGYEDYAWTSQMLENYEGGAISIYMNRNYDSGLKSFSFDNFDGNYQKFYKDFTKVDASELDGYFTAGRITSSGYTVGAKPSELFTSDKNVNENTPWNCQNEYLKDILWFSL